MTPSFCGSVLRTLSTLSSTTYVKRGQDISNTYPSIWSQHINTQIRYFLDQSEVRSKRYQDRRFPALLTVNENSITF